MPVRATSANRVVLRWARERAGLSLEEAAARLGKAADVLQAWESGEATPTYLQLEVLAEKVYKRPVALFFLPQPPEEPTARSEFRTLPDFDLETLAPDSRYALRDAQAYLDSIREITGGENPADRQITRDIRPTLPEDARTLARAVREYLEVPLDDQLAWQDARLAMTSWREAIERVGVFVFKRSFKQREISGFCVADKQFPVVMINNSTSFTRQVFTLLHELCHLLYGVSSLTKDDSRFIDRFTGSARVVETACNRFAAEFLVPSDRFPLAEFSRQTLEEDIARVARAFSVSRDVILRRLLEHEFIDSETYARFVQHWQEQYERALETEEESGGNYYNTRLAYLGNAFLRLAFSRYHAGRLSLPELADHLGVKAKTIGRFEELYLKRE